MGASSPGEDLSWTPPSPGGSSEHALQKRARTDGFSRHLQMQTSTLSIQHCPPFLSGRKGKITGRWTKAKYGEQCRAKDETCHDPHEEKTLHTSVD